MSTEEFFEPKFDFHSRIQVGELGAHRNSLSYLTLSFDYTFHLQKMIFDFRGEKFRFKKEFDNPGISKCLISDSVYKVGINMSDVNNGNKKCHLFF